MIKQTIVALLLSVGASSVFAAGTVKVFSNGSSEAKTLTGAEHLIDLVGQPRLANSWWPGAVISEELATAAALRQLRPTRKRCARKPRAPHAPRRQRSVGRIPRRPLRHTRRASSPRKSGLRQLYRQRSTYGRSRVVAPTASSEAKASRHRQTACTQ